MIGFFRRVGRYARPALIDSPENRLTEVFAAVLERSDGLALAVARDWLSTVRDTSSVAATAAAMRDEGLGLRCPVLTQLWTRGGKFVDMELRFAHTGAPRERDIVLWVEIKHGADTHAQQLENYVAEIGSAVGRHAAVVLLAPAELHDRRPDGPAGVAAMHLGTDRRYLPSAAARLRHRRGLPRRRAVRLPKGGEAHGPRVHT